VIWPNCVFQTDYDEIEFEIIQAKDR